MTNSDDKLARALKAAAGRDLPGEEFDDRVMREVAGGGGESEIAAKLPARPLYWAGLAAALLIGIALGAAFLGGGGDPVGEGGDIIAADAPRVSLPDAKNAVGRPRPIVITINEDGEVWYRGEAREFPELTRLLAKATEGTRDSTSRISASSREVIIRCDVRARWRVVQWTMQSCADPTVCLWRLSFAVRGRKALPVPLPRDPGQLADIEIPASFLVEVRMREGSGDPGITINRKAVSLDGLQNTKLATSPPGKLRIAIDAGADVPFGDVAKVVDWASGQGPVAIEFVGAPAPGAVLEATIEDDLVDPLEEEVKPEILESKPLREHEEIIEDPVIKDAKVSDENGR